MRRRVREKEFEQARERERGQERARKTKKSEEAKKTLCNAVNAAEVMC